jgi:hypothetical protein
MRALFAQLKQLQNHRKSIFLKNNIQKIKNT